MHGPVHLTFTEICLYFTLYVYCLWDQIFFIYKQIDDCMFWPYKK